MDDPTVTTVKEEIIIPPRGLAVLAFVGPSFIWCAEYIGSGEVILATRTGAILGSGVLWAIILGIFLKYCRHTGFYPVYPGIRQGVSYFYLLIQSKYHAGGPLTIS